MKNGIWGLVLLLALSGCGGVNVDVGGGHTEEERLLNGKPVSEYYQQFHYKKVDGEDLGYHYLSNSYTKLKALDRKKNLYFTANIFLFEDGRYVVDYKEAEGEMDPEGFMDMKVIYESREKGTWTIDGLALVLGDLGRGAGLSVNNEQVFSFTFGKALHAPELNQKIDYYYYISSNEGFKN